MPLLNIPNDTKVAVDALSALHQTSPERVVASAVTAFLLTLPDEERAAIDAVLRAAATKRAAAPPAPTAGAPVAAYPFSRLCFRRDVIESLGPNDLFRVDTPTGSFQMTKAQFYAEFPKVIESSSYRVDGIYHYPKVPHRAEQFRL